MDGEMLSLADILGIQRGAQESEARPDHEAQIMEIRALYERYNKMPFSPGDLVTPLPNSIYTHQGEPFIVLEVFDPPIRPFPEEADPSDMHFGARLDMRVASLKVRGGQSGIVCVYVESFYFGPYEKPEGK